MVGSALAPFGARAQALAELYRAALLNNAGLKAREFDAERARAEADGARSRLLPQISAQGNWSTNHYRDPTTRNKSYGGQRANLSLRQSLYEPASQRRVEAAQATIAQREQESTQARMMLFGELLERYLQALGARDAHAMLAAESRAAVQHVDRLTAMRERQMAKVTDLAEAQAYALGLVTRMIDADNDHAVARARLTELSGILVTAVRAMSRVAFDPVVGATQEWIDSALRSSPRVQALALATDAARRSLEASRAEHLPQVAATLSRLYADQGFDNRQQPPYHATSLGLELRVPLYEGGRVDAAVRDALARLGVAEQQLESARREIEREIVTLWLGAQANHARIGSTAAEALALEQTVVAQEKGLELGASRITDVLDARRRLLKARADQAKARYDFVRDVVALKIRRGDLTEGDVAVWSGWFEPANQ